MNNTPALFILVPSNNRRQLLEKQVRTLAKMLDKVSNLDAQIIVSETSSLERLPSSIVSRIAAEDSRFQYLFATRPFSTAEEHILARLPLVQEAYCWILSDDDEPCQDGIAELACVIAKNKYSLLIFDSYTKGASGYDNEPRYGFKKGIIEFTMPQLVEEYGFWHVMAGVSSIVFRACSRLPQVLARHISISPIYAHVTTFIELYHDRCVCTVGASLNWYNKNPYDDVKLKGEEGVLDNWSRFSQRHGCAFRYPWTLGFSSQLKPLVDSGFISIDNLLHAKDRNFERHFKWHVQCLWQIIEQCKYDVCEWPTTKASATLLHDSIARTNNLDWPEFTLFWASILRPSGLSPVVTRLLESYRDIIACHMLIASPYCIGSTRTLFAKRIERLTSRFHDCCRQATEDYINVHHWL